MIIYLKSFSKKEEDERDIYEKIGKEKQPLITPAKAALGLSGGSLGFVYGALANDGKVPHPGLIRKLFPSGKGKSLEELIKLRKKRGKAMAATGAVLGAAAGYGLGGLTIPGVTVR